MSPQRTDGPMQQHGERVWLDVPYYERDQAKRAGARWDPVARRWYAPAVHPALDRWAAGPPVPAAIPGEDRTFGSGLFVDLVPTSCWFTNIRDCVDQRDWGRLRETVYERAGRRCEACGSPSDRTNAVWLEAHERWRYDPQRRVQQLVRLVCLCTRCHETTHLDAQGIQGAESPALRHLASVNGWSRVRAEAHVRTALAVWADRCRIRWTLDISMLTRLSIRIAPAFRPVAEAGSAAAGPPPMGWYDDPGQRSELRWWNGHAWTRHVLASDQSGSAPQASEQPR